MGSSPDCLDELPLLIIEERRCRVEIVGEFLAPGNQENAMYHNKAKSVENSREQLLDLIRTVP